MYDISIRYVSAYLIWSTPVVRTEYRKRLCTVYFPFNKTCIHQIILTPNDGRKTETRSVRIIWWIQVTFSGTHTVACYVMYLQYKYILSAKYILIFRNLYNPWRKNRQRQLLLECFSPWIIIYFLQWVFRFNFSDIFEPEIVRDMKH